jgi:hypothetical protein
MIYQPVLRLVDLLVTGNSAAIDTFNINVAAVNTKHTTSAPTVKAFYGFDLPNTIIERDMPLLFVRTPRVIAESEIQGRRYTELDFEIGVLVANFDATEWREFSALLAEALVLSLDDIRGQQGFVEYDPATYNFVMSAWGRPGEQGAAYGGFVATATVLYHENL